MSDQIAWIAVDWGTSTLRCWAVDAAGAIVAEATSPDGMAGLAPDEFESRLVSLIDTWLPSARVTPVLACGMVGARQGWIEAAYRAVPCTPAVSTALTLAPTQDPRIAVRIVPGLCQIEPPDVMRGEETQIAGFLDHDQFTGTICLPGTHTKWVSIQNTDVTAFTTMMTGEVFALLSQQSVLRHSIAEGWDEEAFVDAVRLAHANPQTFAGTLFSVRAQSLLNDLPGDRARAMLSGTLIGTEIAAIPEITGPVAVLGDTGPSGPYRSALAALGHDVIMADARDATLRGLQKIMANQEAHNP